MEIFCQLAYISVSREEARGVNGLLRRSFGRAYQVVQLLHRPPISTLGMVSTAVKNNGLDHFVSLLKGIICKNSGVPL